jgi:hypothetical protein
MINVYRPNVKAVKLGVPMNTRVVFYQGKAMLYKEMTLIHPNVNTAQAKELFERAKEQAPQFLNAYDRTARMVVDQNLNLPIPVFKF